MVVQILYPFLHTLSSVYMRLCTANHIKAKLPPHPLLPHHLHRLPSQILLPSRMRSLRPPIHDSNRPIYFCTHPLYKPPLTGMPQTIRPPHNRQLCERHILQPIRGNNAPRIVRAQPRREVINIESLRREMHDLHGFQRFAEFRAPARLVRGIYAAGDLQACKSCVAECDCQVSEALRIQLLYVDNGPPVFHVRVITHGREQELGRHVGELRL